MFLELDFDTKRARMRGGLSLSCFGEVAEEERAGSCECLGRWSGGCRVSSVPVSSACMFANDTTLFRGACGLAGSTVGELSALFRKSVSLTLVRLIACGRPSVNLSCGCTGEATAPERMSLLVLMLKIFLRAFRIKSSGYSWPITGVSSSTVIFSDPGSVYMHVSMSKGLQRSAVVIPLRLQSLIIIGNDTQNLISA